MPVVFCESVTVLLFDNVYEIRLRMFLFHILGQDVTAAQAYVQNNPSAHLHLYGKLEAKHNRKMGHVTLFSENPDEVEEFGF